MYYFFILLAVSTYALPQRDLSQYTPGRPVDNVAPGIMPLGASVSNDDDDSPIQPQIDEYLTDQADQPQGQPMILPAPIPGVVSDANSDSTSSNDQRRRRQIQTRPFLRPGQSQDDQPQTMDDQLNQPQGQPMILPAPLPGVVSDTDSDSTSSNGQRRRRQIQTRPFLRPGQSQDDQPQTMDDQLNQPQGQPMILPAPLPGVVSDTYSDSTSSNGQRRRRQIQTRPFARPGQSQDDQPQTMDDQLNQPQGQPLILPAPYPYPITSDSDSYPSSDTDSDSQTKNDEYDILKHSRDFERASDSNSK